MSTAKTGSEQMVLQVMGEDNHDAVIPVKSDSCVLVESSADESNRFECTIKRDEEGAFVQSFSGDVTVNGQQPSSQQRLSVDDQVSVGKNTYRVQQLGNWNGSETAHQTKIEGPANPEALKSVNSRIEKIESELGKHGESFDSIHKSFDSLGQQMEMLMSTLSQAPANNVAAAVESEQVASVESVEAVESSDETECCGKDGCEDRDSECCDQTQAEAVGCLDQSREQDSEFCAEQLSSDESALEDLEAPSCTDVPDGETEVSAESAEVDSARILERLDAFTGPRDEPKGLADSAVTNDEQSEEQAADGESTEDQEALDRLLSSLGSREGESESTEFTASESSETSLEQDADFDSVATDSLDSETEAVESELSSTTAEQPTDDGALEDLFASLREKDQRQVDEATNEAVENSDAAGSDDLSLLDEELQTYKQEEATDSPSQDASEGEAPAGADEMESVFAGLSGLSTESQPESETETETLASEAGTDLVSGLGEELVSELAEEPSFGQETNEIDRTESILSGLQELTESSLLDSDLPLENSGLVDSSVMEGLQTEQQTETEAEAQPQAEEQGSESVAELLTRMQVTPSLDDDEDETTSAVDQPEPVSAPEPAPAPELAQSKPAGEGGSDVQDYMNSLLQRLNTGAPSDAQSSVVASSVSAADAVADVVTDEVEIVAEEPAPKPLNAEDFKPKRVAPEKSSNLAAMRELANASSRSAVKRSAQAKKKEAADIMLLGAGGAIAGAIVCMLLSHQTGDAFYLLSVLMFLATMVCSGLYAKNNLLPSLLGDSKSAGNQQPAPVSESTENPSEDS